MLRQIRLTTRRLPPRWLARLSCAVNLRLYTWHLGFSVIDRDAETRTVDWLYLYGGTWQKRQRGFSIRITVER